MRKEKTSLRLEVRRTAKPSGFYLPWGDAAVSALLLSGLILLLTENLPSIPHPWWALVIAAAGFGIILLALYGTGIGKWILPSGIVIALALGFLFQTQVLGGFGCLGNDALDILTAKTGRIFLDFSAADPEKLPWALILLLAVCTLLVTRSVWNGSFILMLPILVPIYAAVLLGLIPCGLACGLLTIGTVMLLVQHTGKDSMSDRPLGGIPTHLLVPILCVGACILAGSQMEGLLDTEISQRLRDRLHESRYDSETNSMPEGDLSDLPAWNRSETPALEVTMEQPEKLYLRGAVYETYTGTAWEPADPGDRAEYEGLFYWLHRSGFFGQSQIGAASSLAEQTAPCTMTVRNLSACTAHGYSPYAVYGSGDLDGELIGDAAFPAAETLTYLPGSVPEWYQLQNNLASAQGGEAIGQYLTLEQAYADYVEAFDLQLTQESWSVLNRQMDAEDGAHTIAEIRDFIRSYLAENLTYEENVRTMNGDGDFLQYTLERSGCGYSVHYATAAVLMLRYFGVPARYVEGYFLPADEAERYQAGETITLTEEYAHAWAEYYVSGIGFVPFEVTPGYIDDEELAFGSDPFPEETTYEGGQQTFAEVQRPEYVEEREQDRFAFSADRRLLLLAALILLLALLTEILRRRVRLNRALRAIDEAEPRDAIAMRYGYAAFLLRHSTVPAPEGAGEAEKLNQEALFSSHEMTNAQRQTMDDYAGCVLTACKNSWNWFQKLRYRLWDCLY